MLSDMPRFMFGAEEDALLHQVDGEVPVGLVEVDDLPHPRRTGNVESQIDTAEFRRRRGKGLGNIGFLGDVSGNGEESPALLGGYLFQTLCSDVDSSYLCAFVDKP